MHSCLLVLAAGMLECPSLKHLLPPQGRQNNENLHSAKNSLGDPDLQETGRLSSTSHAARGQ
jgi:hypothetical protein